jgi:hypothetical protein
MSSLAPPWWAFMIDCVGPWLLLEALAGRRDKRAPNVVDLARVEINQPEPRPPTPPRLGWSQRTDIGRETIVPRASADLGHVAGVAAFCWPRLVAILTVVPQPRLHPLRSCGGG